MIRMLKNKLKDQQGLTLIELLAVVVILGIIAAIAVPSILGLIDNSKKDAHVANAQQMISATKLAVAGDEDLRPVQKTSTSSYTYVNLKYLEEKGFLETIKDPDAGTAYTAATAANTATASTAFTTEPAEGDSYVRIELDVTGKYSYSVVLVGSKKSIGERTKPVAEKLLKRSAVK